MTCDTNNIVEAFELGVVDSLRRGRPQLTLDSSLVVMSALQPKEDQESTAFNQVSSHGRMAFLDNIQGLLLMRGPNNRDEEARHLIIAISKMLPQLNCMQVWNFVPRILEVTLPLLMDEDDKQGSPHPNCEAGRLVIAITSKSIGHHYYRMGMLLCDELDSESKRVREAAAKALAVMTCSLGVPAMSHFMRYAYMSYKSWRIHHAGIRMMAYVDFLMWGTQPEKAGDNQAMDNQVYGTLLDTILALLLERGTNNRDGEARHLIRAISKVVLQVESTQLVHFVPKILAVTLPLLMDDEEGSHHHPNYEEGRLVIANTSRAIGQHYHGLAFSLLHELDDESEYVREATAKAPAVMTCTLGVPAMMQYIKAACGWHKISWRVRNSSIQLVGHIAVFMGCALGSHIRQLVMLIVRNLGHKDLTVMRITAASLTALAEAAAPYGFTYLLPAWNYFTCFDGLSDQLGLSYRKGEVLVELLRLFASICALTDFDYLPEVNPTEIQVRARIAVEKAISVLEEDPDEKSKEVAFKVLSQWFSSSVVGGQANTAVTLPTNLSQNLWGRTMIFGRASYRMLVDVTLAMANRLGTPELRRKIVEDLNEYSELYRRMVIETIDKALTCRGASDGDPHLEEVFEDMEYLFSSSF